MAILAGQPPHVFSAVRNANPCVTPSWPAVSLTQPLVLMYRYPPHLVIISIMLDVFKHRAMAVVLPDLS